MLDSNLTRQLLSHLYNATLRAGAAIMEVYGTQPPPFEHANRRAHEVIKGYLGPTRIPILSEEGREMVFDERRNWELYWLVDPLDGTHEFIKGSGEFTVNIALMQDKEAVAGAIYVPCLEKVYLAWHGPQDDRGAFVKEGVKPDADAAWTFDEIEKGLHRLPLKNGETRPVKVALSRSHQSPETHAYVDDLRAKHPDLQVVEQGSSYKFCLLAEGAVDIYPRTTDTYEWDTAAGELILREAGGHTAAIHSGEPLKYNEEILVNPHFLATAFSF